jgi:hypothetical protein
MRMLVSCALAVGLLAACSSSPPEVASPTVPLSPATVTSVPQEDTQTESTLAASSVAEAPVESVPIDTLTPAAPTAAETVPPVEASTTLGPDLPPIAPTEVAGPGGKVWTGEEAKVAWTASQLLETFSRERWQQTFQVDAVAPFAVGDQLEFTKKRLGELRASSQQLRQGTIDQTIIVNVTITGNQAIAEGCRRNNHEEWELNGPGSGDDTLVDGDLGTVFIEYKLSQRGGTWKTYATTTNLDRTQECENVF